MARWGGRKGVKCMGEMGRGGGAELKEKIGDNEKAGMTF